MPDQRRIQVAEAAWRIIRRDGLENASVRNIAGEAGLSTGSLRHFFASQHELLTFSMRLVCERITSRIRALDRSGDPRQAVDRTLAELLPLDAERRAEAEVWLAFFARALSDPRLREVRDETYLELASLFRWMAEQLGAADVDTAAERLYALVDGLVLHMIARPDLATAARSLTVLQQHLDDMTGQASRVNATSRSGRGRQRLASRRSG